MSNKTDQRRQQLLEVACDLAEQSHYLDIRRDQLAAAGSSSTGNVTRVLGPMEEMRDALIRFARKNKRYAVVAQAIVAKHPAVADLSERERMAVLRVMA